MKRFLRFGLPALVFVLCFNAFAAAETKAEALAMIREAIELHIEDLRSGGFPVPRSSSVSEVVEVEAA